MFNTEIRPLKKVVYLVIQGLNIQAENKYRRSAQACRLPHIHYYCMILYPPQHFYTILK